MASVRKRSGAWYARWVDADGAKHEVRAGTDKRSAESLAAAMESEAAKVRSGVFDPGELARRGHGRLPIADHLADFDRVDARPVDQFLLHDRQRIRRVEGRHAAASTPDRGSDRFDDDDFVAAELRHGSSLFLHELRGETSAPPR